MGVTNSEVTAQHEAAQSVASYVVGGGGAVAAALIDISQTAQALAIILGCCVVAVRLVHDTIRLIKYLTGSEK